MDQNNVDAAVAAEDSSKESFKARIVAILSCILQAIVIVALLIMLTVAFGAITMVWAYMSVSVIGILNAILLTALFVGYGYTVFLVGINVVKDFIGKFFTKKTVAVA
jgi:hypothetical protein